MLQMLVVTLREGIEAFLIVANAERAYLISGTGDLIQPDDGILAIGSGGPYALAAARALMKHTQLNAAGIVLGRFRRYSHCPAKFFTKASARASAIIRCTWCSRPKTVTRLDRRSAR